MSGSSGCGKSSAPQLGGGTEQHRPYSGCLTVPALGVQGCPRGREAPSLLGTAGKHSSRVLSSPRGCACPVTVTAAVVALPAERCCRGGCTRAGLPFTSPSAKQVHSDNRVKIGIKKWNVKQQLSWLSCSAC